MNVEMDSATRAATAFVYQPLRIRKGVASRQLQTVSSLGTTPQTVSSGGTTPQTVSLAGTWDKMASPLVAAAADVHGRRAFMVSPFPCRRRRTFGIAGSKSKW